MPVRWRIVLEYEGTRFEGWQVQPGRRTVHGEVAGALERLLGHPVELLVSGRTDAGVHAEGQAAAFDAVVVRTPRAIRDGLNAHLPDDVACVSAEEVDSAFDPRAWSWGKLYRYRWLDRPARSPLRQARVWHVRGRLDEAAMHVAAEALLGRHDFSAFRAAGCGAKHAVREITAIEVVREADEVRLDVRGNGFLRHMVRIVAGTLAEVGQGRQPPAWVADVLGSRDRAAAGRTAPARGLTLVAVTYGDGPPPWTRG